MFKEINVNEWKHNPFQRIGTDWMLISAANEGKTNAMTASWGAMGILWNKPVAMIFVRPQRFTNSLLAQSDHFALTFFDASQRSMLAYMGKASGKTEDKIAHANLHVIHDHAPYFEEASEVMICRKLFAQELDPESILDTQVDQLNYPDKDYHILYVGEIEKVLVKQNA